ncbi:hypothetical protein C0993_007591 [Termitomyces sp. T159_Od127]|nr:hypothetical protein C0993_007591 [Termitomyces sp. T159_Od127]
MANYLPVLLVSVAANSVPDDSSVATLPRAQVDYLSHNWEEEDVWRSWRNMTRQKNEIANGVRLENASWRTWWKQRNGLGTVTPETLNWLKDSDVTWLYGPLHTAGDWAPPPKPVPSAGLDLTTHKPILKHRSISQFLTSDFPSPVFSPTEAEVYAEGSYFARPPPDEPDGSSQPRRPVLPHTKSDTHITRWGPNRAFRKDSPPRIDPPAQPHSPPGIPSPEGYSSSNNQSSDSTTPAPPQQNGQKKRHISFNTFVEQCIAIDKPKKRSGYAEDDEDDEDDHDVDDETGEHDHLHRSVAGRYPYGRNAWGYDDGYEQDADEEESDEDAEAVSISVWDERFRGNRAISGSDSDSYEDGIGEEEGQADEDEGDGVTDMRSYSRTKSSSSRSQSTASTASSSSSASTSTSMSNSTSPTSESPDRLNPEKQPFSHRRHSTSSNSTCRPRFQSSSGYRRRRNAPPLIRTIASERGNATIPSAHVTIAPIAPTILKTGTNGYYGHHHGGWSEGFGDEGGSDDGIWGGSNGQSRWWSEKGKGKANEESESSGGQTPVELVYVPPFGGSYNLRKEREQRIYGKGREDDRDEQKGVKFVNGDVKEDHEDGFGNGDQDVYRRRSTLFSVGDIDLDLDVDDAVTRSRGVLRNPSVPTVVVRPEDAYNPGRGDVGEDFRSRRSSSSSLSRDVSNDFSRGRGAIQSSPAVREEAMNERERSQSKSRSHSRSYSRSHSRSHSRTPSPAMISDLSGDGTPVPAPDPGPGHTHGPVLIPRRSTSSSTFASPAAALLSPPARTRGSQSYQDVGSAPQQQQQQQQQQRGRSNTRTGSSISDRERSAGSKSLGSLSPEKCNLGGVAATAYTGGRYERDRRDRERERERPRGRERIDNKRLGPGQGLNVNPEGVQDSLLRVSPASAVSPVLPVADSEAPTINGVTPKTKASASSVSSSSSRSSTSSTTVVPSNLALVGESDTMSLPLAVPIDVRTAEEHQRTLQPTPSNTPVIQMGPVSVTPAATTVDSKLASNDESNRTSTQPHTTPTAAYTPKITSLLVVPAATPAEPSTSYSISPPRNDLSPPSSPRSPTRGEPTIVGKAVEMVSSAGAFLGLWNLST